MSKAELKDFTFKSRHIGPTNEDEAFMLHYLGYENNLVMAGGTFVDGSTSEFSADAPMKPPFDLFIQGGSHRSHVKIALIHALSNLFQAGLIKLPQNE